MNFFRLSMISCLLLTATAMGATQPTPVVVLPAPPTPQIVSSSVALPAFTPTQTAEIEQIVHQYLVKHPEVLIEVSDTLRKQEFEKEKAKGVDGAKANVEALFGPANELIGGNPQGTVTLVEFFDYQCGHCKEMVSTIGELIKSHPNLRVVYKDFPIFGPASMLAVNAAYAANKQKKYAELQQALLKSEGPLSKKSILSMAKKVGLNTVKLEKDMDAQEEMLKSMVVGNFKLVKAMGIGGTPAFVVAKTDVTKNPNATIEFFPGAVPKEALEDAINQASK